MHEHYLYSKITVIAEDNTVIIDGLALKVDCSDLPLFVHAIQWDGTKGEIEFKPGVNGFRPAPMTIVDLKPYHFLLDRWDIAAGTHYQAEAARKVGLEWHARDVQRAEAENENAERDAVQRQLIADEVRKKLAAGLAAREQAALDEARKEAGL